MIRTSVNLDKSRFHRLHAVLGVARLARDQRHFFVVF
jgi:hypothetical protein